jgi:putative copper export protein/ABC-type branched-subunit amino acid transport system substrate-binding protein
VASQAPTSIQLAFTEGLVIKGCSITIQSGGKTVKVGAIRSALGGDAMSAKLPKLAEGIYTVKWVAYGNDGHTVAGGFQFGVPSSSGQPPPGASRLLATTASSAESAPVESLISVAGRWLAAVAAFALLGALTLLLRLRGRLDEQLRTATERRWLRIAPAAVLVALAGTLMEGIKRSDGPHGLNFGLLTEANTGVSIIVRFAVLLIGGIAGVALARRARPQARTTVYGATGALALGALAIDGHVATVTSTPWLADIGMILHLVSGGIWMGAVMVIALCLVPATIAGKRSDALLASVRAYAPVAIAAAGVMIVTGVIAAVREVHRWYFLRWSSYGHLLIIKVVIVGVVLALGAAGTLLARRALASGSVTEGDHRRAGRLMRAEALLAVVTVAVAALLAGTLQGRGQPLPSQRGALLPGIGLADVALPGAATGELTLAPDRVGLNRIIVVPSAASETGSQLPPAPKSVSVAFACSCGGGLSFHVALHPGSAGPGGAWSAEVALPRDGTYSAELKENGRPTVGSPTFTVGDVSSPGSTPVTVASVADLSGPDAIDCRSQELGALTAIELMNAAGGIGGNKIRQEVLDDEGSPSIARTDALQLAKQHPVAFLAPCGQGAQAAVAAVGNKIPTVVADDNVPVTQGKYVYRLAPNPYAEGYAVGQYVGKIGIPSDGGAKHRLAAFMGDTADSRERLAGLEAGLKPYGISVRVFNGDGGDLVSELESVLPAAQWIGIYADGSFDALTSALRTVGNQTANSVNPTPIIVSQRLATERFVIDSGLLGAEGQIRAVTDVDPTSNDAPLYAELVNQVVGELATTPGLAGFVAGQALAYGLVDGSSVSDIAKRLQAPGVFSKIATSPWDSRNPAAGTLIFRVILAEFLSDNLIPEGTGAASEPYEGQWFEDGAWEPATPELFSPLNINLTGDAKGSENSAGGVYRQPLQNPAGGGTDAASKASAQLRKKYEEEGSSGTAPASTAKTKAAAKGKG